MTNPGILGLLTGVYVDIQDLLVLGPITGCSYLNIGLKNMSYLQAFA